jgi:hypothetical protein
MTVPGRIVSIVREIVVLPIRGYQQLFSAGSVPRCIYAPTCSTFVMESIRRFGVFRGGLAGLLRVLRCTGLLFEGGYEPLPDRAPVLHVLRGYGSYVRFRKKRGDEPRQHDASEHDGRRNESTRHEGTSHAE